MTVRKRKLPAGWYPVSGKDVEEYMLQWKSVETEQACCSSAVIIPHAGWYYSGFLAWKGISSLIKDLDTIAVIGGHLRAASGILSPPEDGYETPLGIIQADRELKEYLTKKITIREDLYDDNTVEIQLPIIKALFPETKVLWLRASPSKEAVILGKCLAEACKLKKGRLGVIGSTDLTHYGTNYGFSPQGQGDKAVKWVKTVNDKKLVQSLLEMDADRTILLGEMERSACSAGGAAAACSMAAALGIKQGKLLGYYTSYDIAPADSFVGYAAIAYGRSI